MVNNSAILISLSLIYDWFFLRYDKPATIRKLAAGAVLGAIGILVMLVPLTLRPGLIFDTRSIVLSITGLFFGFIPTLTACAMTALLRILQGGVGMWTGLGVILSSGLLGLLWHHWHRQQPGKINFVRIYLLGVIVHLVMLAWMLILPWEQAKDTLLKITLPVMIIYPLATMMLGILMKSYLIRRSKEQEISDRESRFRSYINNSPDGIFVADESGFYKEVNPAACRITGYSRTELLSMHISSLLPESAKTTAKEHFQTVSEHGIASGEFAFLHKSGAIRYWTVDAIKLNHGTFIGFVHDITESKTAIHALQRTLAEKDVLLKELYHRTKNNMQVIRSMLALQAAYSKNNELHKILKETENRIQSMSLVHQMLYQSQNLSHLNIKTYIQELIELLLKSHTDQKQVQVSVSGAELELSIESAVPCGLIITELISNSFKHAFPHTDTPEISVSIEPVEDKIQILYTDNGPGFKIKSFSELKTLGLKTVQTIVKHQLAGNLQLYNSKSGFSLMVQFPVHQIKNML